MKKEIAINTPDIVNVMDHLYVKKEESLPLLIKELQEKGYSVKESIYEGSKEIQPTDPNYAEIRKKRESKPYYIWFAKLSEDVLQDKAICNHCGSIIDKQGIRVHKHLCPVCGEFTYLEVKEDSTIRFKFVDNGENLKDNITGITLKIKEYDEAYRCLVLYPQPIITGRPFEYNKKDARDYLKRHNKSWSYEIRDHKKYIIIKHDIRSPYTDLINVMDIKGSEQFYKDVKLYKGEVLNFLDTPPIPEYLHIVEAWRWAPLKKSSTLHEDIISAAGMVSRCDYYYQDGRQAFFDVHLKRMKTFVEHFTEIKIENFNKFLETCSLAGPEFIEDLAHFIAGKRAVIRNNPNIGNLLSGFPKLMTGQYVSSREMSSIRSCMNDSEIMGEFISMFK